MDAPINILADYREIPSTIPELLKEKGACVEFRNLKTGDYIVNGEMLFERKSKDDFVLSIIQNRLFTQCSRMKRSKMFSLVLLEGNPYQTQHNIGKSFIG